MRGTRLYILAVCLATALYQLTSSTVASAVEKGFCPNETVQFGTINSVHGDDIFIEGSGFYGHEDIIDNHAVINHNGLTLRPGVFVGAFGCFESERMFRASEITLATSESTFPHGARHIEEIEGRVLHVMSGRLQIQSGRVHGLVTINTSFVASVGQAVSATGFFNTDGTFDASKVTIEPPAENGPIAISGDVVEMHSDGFSIETHAGVGQIRVVSTDAKVFGAAPKLGSHISVYGTFTNDRRSIMAKAVIVSEEGTF